MKNQMKLHILSAAITAIIFNGKTIAATTFDGRQFNTYKAEIIVQDGGYKCDLVNMEASSDFSIGVKDGGFNAVVKEGWTCNLDVFLNSANQIEVPNSSGPLSPINPYTTQRNGAQYGQMSNINGTFTFMTERAGTAAIWVQPKSQFVTTGNLEIIQNTTNAHSLYIQGGEAIINGDLSIDRTRAVDQIDDYARALIVNGGGTLNVKGDLTTQHRMATNVNTSKNSGTAWDLANGTIKIDGAGSINSNLNSYGIRATDSSELEVGSDLTIVMTQFPGHSAAFAITSDNSTIEVKGDLSVDGDEHVLINQGNDAVLTINGETTLTKTKSGNYIQNNHSEINFNNDIVNFVGTGGNGLVNSNKGEVRFNDNNTNVNGDSLTQVISNNNAKIDFLGAKSTVTGTVGNANNGVININGESIFDKTSNSNLIENDNAVINFNNEKIAFNGVRASGLVNTNNAHVYFNAANTVVNASTLDNAIVNSNNATLHFVTDLSTVNGNINNINRGIITLQNGQLDTKLTVNGNYVGNNGILMMDVDLDDDSSKKDFVTINGDASGTTELQVNNLNGLGAPTKNGIHIIQTNNSDKDTFYIANKGYVSAGAYDYYLEYREKGAEKNTLPAYDNWYLMNYDYKDYIYTPDIGSYLATETMGNTLFTSRLEDREGASQFQKLNDKDKGNVWVRAYGGHNQFKTMDSQLKTTGNSFVTQIGAGLVTLGEEDQYNLGVMGGFAHYDGKTRSNLTTRASKAEINGYSLGLYGTWYAHPVEERGAYIDSWVLWNSFNNKIDTPDQNRYKYKSSGVTASIEVGGDYLLNEDTKQNWWIQPQTQLIYQGVHSDNFKDAQGIDINHGKDNLQARIGVKTYLNIPTNGSKLTSYRPYVALNFIHNTNPYSVTINDVQYVNEGSANQGELKIGLEGHTTKNSQVWINTSYIAGRHNHRTYQGNIGWKYNF